MVLPYGMINTLIVLRSLLFFCCDFTCCLSQNILPPGDSLNRALEAFAASISALQADMNGLTPERISKIEHEMNESIKSVELRMTVLSNKLQLIQTNWDILMQKIPASEDNMKKLEAKTERMNDKVSEVVVKTGILKTEMDKLDKANQIWRRNFRIVSNTFAALRKTVSFNVPSRLA